MEAPEPVEAEEDENLISKVNDVDDDEGYTLQQLAQLPSRWILPKPRFRYSNVSRSLSKLVSPPMLLHYLN